MKLTAQLARHFREIYFGGNWTDSNLKDQLAGVTWQQATVTVYSLKPIAVLVYHIHYFTSAVLKVLEGGRLDAHDRLSFDAPPVHSPEDWDNQLARVFTDAEKFAFLVERLPDDTLWETFCDDKYGSYYRNIHGIIEHAHYHLGQIVIIRKLLAESNKE